MSKIGWFGIGIIVGALSQATIGTLIAVNIAKYMGAP